MSKLSSIPLSPHVTGVSEPPVRALSAVLWDLDWRAWLPQVVSDDGVTVHASSYKEAAPFIERHYPSIFDYDVRPSRFRSGGTPHARRRYYAAVGDFFLFRHGDETVALLIGTPIDWGSYYLRSAAALPAYQGRAIVQRFFPFLFQQLRAAGVERVEADTSPSNFASLQNLTRLRFHVTGTVLSERWGSLVRLTKFLDEAASEVFLDQFCDGVRYEKRA